MADFVGMLLQAKIDPDAISNIQEQIENISKNAKAIKLNIDVDDKVLKDIENINKKIGLAVNKSSNEVKTDGNFDKLKIHMSAANNIKKIVTDTTIKYGEQLQTIEKLNSKTGELELTEQKLTINKEKQSKVENTIQEAIAKTIQMREEAERKAEQQQSKYINKALEDNYKLQQQEEKRTQELREQVELFKKQQEIKVKNLEGKYKGTYDKDAIAEYRQELQKLSADTPNATHEMKRMTLGLKNIETGAKNSKKSLDLANKSSMSFGEALKTAAYKFGIWSVVTASYYKMISEIRKGIRYITEMDTALTEIGMVTNQTREQTAKLAKEYNNLAKEMKVTTSEITSGAVEFYRQGLSQEEVMKRLKVTTMYSKVANVEFKQSAELLTATVNSMGISIEKAADVFLFLGDATATSGEEIGKGFAKTSGSAAALGVEFEKVASWIATISSRTRESAESIGHSISTILSRLSRITETGFNEEDDTKLNDVSKALHTVGIELTDQEGNFRNFGIIMDEIYAKWGNLDDQTKAYIANVMAGTRQQSRFYNLMEGYGESIDLYNESLEAAGTAQSKFNLYLESNQATLDKFRTTIEGLWVSFLDSDSLMNLVKVATSFIEVLDSMVQKLGSIGTVATLIVPIIGIKLAWAFRTAYMEVVKLIAAGTAKEAIAMGGIFQNWALRLIGVQTAAGGAAMSLGALTLVTAGLTAGIGLLVYGIMKWAQKSREAEEAFANALDNSQKLNDDVTSLEQLANKQEELTNIENKSVEQKEELIKVQRELAQLYPELATGIDSEGNKIADNIDLTKQLTEDKRKLLEQELLIIKTTADKKLPILKQELEAMQAEAEEIQKRLTSGDVKETVYVDGYKMQIDTTEKLKDRLLELVDAQKEHMEEINKLEVGVKSYNQILEENAEKQKWARVEELQGQATKAESVKELKRIEEELKKLGFTSEDVANIMSGSIDLVKEKYKELDMQQIINLQTIETLDETQKQTWINMLENSENATKQLIEDTKSRIGAIMAEAKAMSALSGDKFTVEQITEQKDPYAIKSPMELLTKKTPFMSPVEKVKSANLTLKLKDAKSELNEYESMLKEIKAAQDNIDKIKPVSGGYTPTSGSGSKSKSKSTKEEYKAEVDRYERLNLELDKNNILLQKNKTLQDLTGDELSKKIPLMEEEILLNKQRQNSLHEYNNEQRKEVKELEKILSKQGFKFAGEGDQRMITNLDNIKGKTKEVEEAFNRYIQLQKTEIPRVSQDWWNLKNTIEKVGQSIQDITINKVRELIEAEKQNAYLDLERRQRRANERLETARQEMEDDVEFYQNKIDRVQKEIDDIQESERARAENLERAKRLEEISKLQNRYYALQYQNLSDLTEEQAKALDLEKEREQYLERQAKIQELLIKLENIRNEKNIQQLTKKKDGTWDFEYVADQKEIDDINKQVEDLQKEHGKALTDLKERTLEDLKQKQEDYDEWERQNDIRRQIERKQQRIQRYQDEIKDLQDKYAEKEKRTNEAFAREKENLDRYYMDIDKLTDEKMKELNETFGENWVEIYGTLTGFFENISREYDKLVDKLSTPLPTPSYEADSYYEPSSRSGGNGGGGSSSSSRNSSSSDDTRDGYTRMRKPNGGTTQVINSRVDDLEKKGWGVLHKGGIVGDGSRDLSETVNKLFNTKADEQMVKAKIGELFVPKENLAKYFVPNMQELLKSAVLSTVNLVTPTVPKVALAGAAGGDIKQNINIDKLEFPNVKDAREIEGAIKNLSTFANQWANRK